MILIVLLGAAAAASGGGAQPAPVGKPPRSPATSIALGYYLRGARLLGTDEPARRVHDPRGPARREARRNGSWLERRAIDYAPARADTLGGHRGPRRPRPGAATTIELTDAVEMRSSQPTDGRADRARDDSETAIPADDVRCRNRQHPVMSVGGWHARGKRAPQLLKADRMELESDVHGQFAP